MASQVPRSPATPVLHTRGSYYDVGYNVGFTFADRIRRYWTESIDLNTVAKPYASTAKGQEFCNNILRVCKENFPEFTRELEGIADGSGMELRDILLMNMKKEVQCSMYEKTQTPHSESAGCSDVFVNRSGFKLLAHNEDSETSVLPYGYMVKASIVENGVEMENFTAWCYPGALPGGTVSLNRSGMVFTVDALYPDYIAHNAPPRAFLNRSIIRGRNLAEIQTLTSNKPYGVAYGFTVNVVDFNNPKSMWSIEVGPRAKESIVHLHEVVEVADKGQRCDYIHTNSFKHLGISQLPCLGSSDARLARAEEMAAEGRGRTREDVLRIMGDQSNEIFPVFRSDRPSEPKSTIFTTVIEPLRNRVDFYQGNPALLNNQPCLHFNVLDP